MYGLLVLSLTLLIGTTMADRCQGDEVADPSGMSCYLIKNHRQSFIEARNLCAQNRGFQLVRIDNMIDNNFLWKLAETTGYYSNYYFIGASMSSNGSWSWTDGSDLEFQNWSRINTDGACAALRILDGRWQPFSCDDTLPFFCYGPAGNSNDEWNTK